MREREPEQTGQYLHTGLFIRADIDAPVIPPATQEYWQGQIHDIFRYSPNPLPHEIKMHFLHRLTGDPVPDIPHPPHIFPSQNASLIQT
ncbi:hypothetical protein [Aeromonas enteropelogenes]|uniref:hypothetical protein n=1 Tax=Aeromonas enteropelogenes TaxID=29489 RepID=UPI0012E07ED2|nr:hypothetical protein [Aeromonas enteropelogenes]UBH52497.1 hypothetical protein LA321_01035 [Aeromonas enteropelogenes]